MVTLEKVRDKWSKIVNMKGAQNLDSIQTATSLLAESLDQMSNGNAEESNSNEDEFCYDDGKFILYALGGELA